MNATLSMVHSEIARLGPQFNPDILAITRSLYSGIVSPASSDIKAELDIAYGPHPRQKLDLYRADGNDMRPVLLFVPGGGFTGGDKRIDDVFYGNLARWFAARGFVVMAMNYRLAPDHAWPSGGDDVGLGAGVDDGELFVATMEIPPGFSSSGNPPARPMSRPSGFIRRCTSRSPVSPA